MFVCDHLLLSNQVLMGAQMTDDVERLIQYEGYAVDREHCIQSMSMTDGWGFMLVSYIFDEVYTVFNKSFDWMANIQWLTKSN